MAQMTSAEAAKLLRKFKDELETIVSIEENSKDFIVTLGEDPESIRPEYDFLETNKRIDLLQTKIRLLKHEISVFNINTILPEIGITIDQALVLIPQLSKKCYKLYSMKNKLPKTREKYGWNGGSSNFVEYSYINYDINAASKEYDECKDWLDKVRLQLDYVNSNVKFTVDDSLII